MAEIYIVEDDGNIRELVSYALSSSGYTVYTFSNSKDFFEEIKKTGKIPSLLVLDVMLPEPGVSGLEVLKEIRESKKFSHVPVILLTALVNESSRIKGLELGADDYITKPFSILEFGLRVKAILRRCENKVPLEKVSEEISIGDLKIFKQEHKVMVGNKEISLTNKEFELLCYLMVNVGIVLTRVQILETVWGFDFEGESRTVDIHIGTIRQKLGNLGNLIETIRGVGYKINHV